MNAQPQAAAACQAAVAVTEAKVAAISALLTLCERATINLNESLTNAVKACIVVCLKFVDKRAVYDALLKDAFIDWEYITGSAIAQTERPKLLYPTEENLAVANAAAAASASNSSSSLNSYLRGKSAKKTNLLGDSDVWLQLLQFVDFGDLKLPERLLQQQYPPLYCMHSAIAAQMVGKANRLNFSDTCKQLLLNNIEVCFCCLLCTREISMLEQRVSAFVAHAEMLLSRELKQRVSAFIGQAETHLSRRAEAACLVQAGVEQQDCPPPLHVQQAGPEYVCTVQQHRGYPGGRAACLHSVRGYVQVHSFKRRDEGG
jgi:hypothetical protein